MSQAGFDNQKSSDIAIPLWVKSILVIGLGLFLSQLIGFPSILSDSIEKNRAETAFANGNYPEAIENYEKLLTSYPKDKNLIKNLGLSFYKQGLYYQALRTFEKLEGKEIPESDVKVIEEAIEDMLKQL